MPSSLPAHPNLENLKKQAKTVLKGHGAGDTQVLPLLRRLHRFTNASDAEILAAEVSLSEVHFALALEYGFKDWDELKTRVESLQRATTGAVDVVEPSGNLPGPEALRTIVAEAVTLGASDTHLEWHRGRLAARHRVDGELRPSPTAIPEDQQNAVIAGVKALAGLNAEVHDQSQIGFGMWDSQGKRLSMRVAVEPYTSGESVVVRYLVGAQPGLFDLEVQGWAEEDLKRLRQWITRPNGLIVVTGPTGAGKTTTIYGALCELAKGNLKIVTVEDPVEYELEGVLQQQVGASRGVTHVQAVRNEMRQDLDAMMIGECRDLETVEAALTVALTGHLVLTAMHVQDAPSCVRRLLDIGAEPYRLAGALTGVLAQRLVRRVCPDCKAQYEPPAWVRQSMPDLPAGPVFKGKGCSACKNTGFRGRTVIGELLEVDDALRLIIARGGPADELRKQAITSGMRPLRTAGLAKAVQGITSVDEVLRVCAG